MRGNDCVASRASGHRRTPAVSERGRGQRCWAAEKCFQPRRAVSPFPRRRRRVASAVRGGAHSEKPKNTENRGEKMTRAIKIEDLVTMDDTSIQILRVISLHLGANAAGYVDYNMIARSLNLDRDTVRKSVNRMIRKQILKKENGKLSILKAVVLN